MQNHNRHSTFQHYKKHALRLSGPFKQELSGCCCEDLCRMRFFLCPKAGIVRSKHSVCLRGEFISLRVDQKSPSRQDHQYGGKLGFVETSLPSMRRRAFTRFVVVEIPTKTPPFMVSRYTHKLRLNAYRSSRIV